MTSRPAESGGVAAAIAVLIAYFAGLDNPGVIAALAAVVGFIPAAVTWIVTLIRGPSSKA